MTRWEEKQTNDSQVTKAGKGLRAQVKNKIRQRANEANQQKKAAQVFVSQLIFNSRENCLC